MGLENLPPQTPVIRELRPLNSESAPSCPPLEAQCRQYRQMVEFVTDPYLVSRADGTIEYANQAALALFGENREVLVGKPLMMFVPEKNHSLFRALLNQLRISGEIQQCEMDFEASGGVRFRASLVVSATEDSPEEVTRLHWLIRDLTESREVVKNLHESEERYRMIFEHSPLGILHFDRNGTVVDSNKQLLEILGATREKLIGFNMLQSVRDERMHTAVVEALSGKIGHYEGDYLSITGNKLIALRVLYSVIASDEGELLGGVGIFEDVTERKQAEKARMELSRQRLEACNVLAHELRNALIKIGFVFPAINSVMSFLREQWEMEIRKAFPNLQDKNSIIMRLGELILMGQSLLGDEKGLVQLSEELLAEQVIVANLYFLPVHGKSWLENKIRPKWHRLLTESKVWEKNKEEVHQLLKHLEEALWIPVDEDLAKKLTHLPKDLRVEWPRLAYTEFSTANLSLLEEVLRLLDKPSLRVQHKQQLRKLLISLKALGDTTSDVEDRMNRILSSLRREE